ARSSLAADSPWSAAARATRPAPRAPSAAANRAPQKLCIARWLAANPTAHTAAPGCRCAPPIMCGDRCLNARDIRRRQVTATVAKHNGIDEVPHAQGTLLNVALRRQRNLSDG